MTKDEAAIVSAYTGFMIGDFHHFHSYVEKIMGRPVWTHEMGTGETSDKIKELAKKDFISIEVN